MKLLATVLGVLLLSQSTGAQDFMFAHPPAELPKIELEFTEFMDVIADYNIVHTE